MNIKLFLICVFLALLPQFTNAQDSDKKPCACCTEDHRAFDFWLGDWEVFTPNDKLAGTNKIVLMQDSCIIQENWISATPGYTGTSYNWYNSASKTWHQSWIDNQGGSLLLSGTHRDNQMILSSEATPDGKGGQMINRITWTDLGDGSVRQHWEVSRDQGETFKTAFDGLYKPAKE
jgi:hypothetical protein